MPPTTPPTIAPVCGLGGDEVVEEDEVVGEDKVVGEDGVVGDDGVVEPSVYLKGV